MRRALLVAAVALALLVVPAAGWVSAPADGGGAAAASPAKVSIVNVAVEPSSPNPGEQVVITPTVKVLEDSTADFEFTDVALRTPGGDRLQEYTRVENLGTMSPGSELSVPMVVSFDEPGIHRFRVHAYGNAIVENGSNRNVHVQYPVVVDVRRSGQTPQVDVSVSPKVANASATANVTVSNGVGEPLRNVEVSVDGGNVSVDRERRVLPTLADGESRTFRFPLSAASAGSHTLNATLRYSQDGTTRTTTRESTVEFAPLSDDVRVDARATDDGRSVVVDVTNRGNAPLESVFVSEHSDAVDAPARSVGRLPVDASRTVRLNVSGLTGRDGEVDVPVSVAYDVGDRSGRVNASATLSSIPGEVQLTGLDVSQEDGRVRISGSASNVGLSRVDSVVVRVRSSNRVDPAYPNKEYFVGRVAPSEFAAFDVYATVLAENVNEIELEVSYLSNGERRSKVVSVDYSGGPTTGTDRGGGLADMLPLVLTGLALGAVGSLVYRGWRNRDAGG